MNSCSIDLPRNARENTEASALQYLGLFSVRQELSHDVSVSSYDSQTEN